MPLFYNISTLSDDPMGIKIMNNPTKTLEGILFPREKLAAFDHMSESKQAGVYILYHTADKNEKPLIYIGQSSVNIANRLKSHDKKKDFWNYALVFVEKNSDINMNGAHTKLIESYLIEKASECEIANMDNSAGSNAPRIQESDKFSAQTWAEEVIAMTQLLGLYFFVPSKEAVKEKAVQKLEGTVFYIKKKNYEARGAYINSNDFVVYKGSSIATEPTNSCPKGIKKAREENSDKLNGNILKKDIHFTSPSAASGFVCYASSNGPETWQTASGQTFNGYKKQLEAFKTGETQ